MHATRTVHFLLIAASVLVILTAGYYLLFDQIRKKNEDVSRLHHEIDRLLAEDRRSEDIKALLDTTQMQRAQLDTYFIAQEGIVSFLEEVEGLGDVAGVAVITESVGAVTDTQRSSAIHEVLKISLRTTGSWRGVYHFLALLEALPYALAFEKVHVQEESEGDGWSGSFVFTIAKLK